MTVSPGARIAVFVALLAVVFAGAALAGGVFHPGGQADDAAGGHASAASGAHEHGGETTAGAAQGTATPAGLASSDGVYRLVSDATRFEADRTAPLSFRIVDSHGATERAFENEQARRMHLIVVRRDLRRYQHLYPIQQPDGGWTVDLTLPDAGVYRAYADFRAAGAQHTLGIDLFAPGNFAPLPLPKPADAATIDGYEVTLHEHPGEIGFTVRRGKDIVTDLQPYLGARGHLVILREGDLAYEHVHPLSNAPSDLAFQVGDATPGTYRMFLQFRHGARVHTAAFTHTVS